VGGQQQADVHRKREPPTVGTSLAVDSERTPQTSGSSLGGRKERAATRNFAAALVESYTVEGQRLARRRTERRRKVSEPRERRHC
jgi:hypothetical protein